MSEVKRYFADLISAYDTVPIENLHDVQVVLATDYAALETERDAALAECERLRADAERWKYFAPRLAERTRETMQQINAEIDAALSVKP